jgi:hypothetical protein
MNAVNGERLTGNGHLALAILRVALFVNDFIRFPMIFVFPFSVFRFPFSIFRSPLIGYVVAKVKKEFEFPNYKLIFVDLYIIPI